MKVLVVENDPERVKDVFLCFQLRWSEIILSSTNKGNDAIEMVESESPDLVILGTNMPDTDGFEVLREIRSFSDVPLIIVTDRAQEMDRVRGLELGADDYVLYPFSPLDLLARAKAVLRRSHMPQLRTTENDTFSCTGFSINFATHEVYVKGKAVKLTPTEYNLLYYLTRNEGKILSHRTLLEKIWGESFTDSTEYLKKYISRLRMKLGDDSSSPRMILNHRGVGYKFIRPS